MRLYIKLGMLIGAIVTMISYLASGYPSGEYGMGYPLSKEEAAARLVAADLSRGPFVGLHVTAKELDSDWVQFVADSAGGQVVLCEVKMKPASSRVVMDATCSEGIGEFVVDGASHELMLTAFGELVDAALTGRPFDSAKVDADGAGIAFYQTVQGHMLEAERRHQAMDAEAAQRGLVDEAAGDWGTPAG